MTLIWLKINMFDIMMPLTTMNDLIIKSQSYSIRFFVQNIALKLFGIEVYASILIESTRTIHPIY